MNEELIPFPKGEYKITSTCIMISDDEVPSDVVPTAWCHSDSLNTHIDNPALSTVAQPAPAATRSCRSESFCGSCNTAQTISKSQRRTHSLSEHAGSGLSMMTLLDSAASSAPADDPAENPRFDLPGSRSQLAGDSSSMGLQISAGSSDLCD